VQLAIAMNQFLFVKLDSSWVRLFTCNLLERNQNIFSTEKSTFVETGNLPEANEEGFRKNYYFRVLQRQLKLKFIFVMFPVLIYSPL
jgi:hypothetical protein